jgi:two-component system sporulation sensor kinase A
MNRRRRSFTAYALLALVPFGLFWAAHSTQALAVAAAWAATVAAFAAGMLLARSVSAADPETVLFPRGVWEFFDSMPTPALAFEASTRLFVKANAAACLVLEIDNSGLKGRTMESFLPESDRESFLKELAGRDDRDEPVRVRRVRPLPGRELTLTLRTSVLFGGGRKHYLVQLELPQDNRNLRERLANHEERSHFLAESSSEALLLLSAEGLVIYCSPSVTNVIGYDPAERIGHRSAELLHSEDVLSFTEAFRRCLREPGRSERIEVRARHKDGRTIHATGTLRNMLDQPSLKAVLLTYHDTTAEYEAREALVRSEAFFRALVEQSRETVLLVGPDLSIRYASPNSEGITGFRPEERIDKDVRSQIHPDDHDRVRSELKRAMGKPGGSVRGECRVRHKDGRWVTVEAEASNRLADPAINALVITYRDVTVNRAMASALKENEEYYRAIIENSRDIIAILRKDGTVSYENPDAFAPLGFAEADLGQFGPFGLVHPEDLPEVLRRIDRYREDPSRMGQMGVRLRTREGRYREFEASARNLRDNTVVRGVLVQLRDMSEAKDAQRRMLRLERLAAVGQTASGLAHDVRSPLTVISGRADFLRSQLEDRPALKEEAESILRQCERLRNLVQAVLERSRPREVVPERVWAKELLERSLTALQTRQEASLSRILVQRDYADPDPAVKGDPSQLERVFSNLLLNAVQAMPSGGNLYLAVRPVPEGVTLEIGDDGPGLPDEILARIFEPFVTTKEGGFGLGLWICRSVVEEHGGTIEAVRRSAGGALFRVILPVWSAENPRF